MWYFNSATRSCQQFSFNGCGGNANNFESQTSCQATCGGQQPTSTYKLFVKLFLEIKFLFLANPCPAGRNPQTDAATGQPALCAFGGSGSPCASGFSCAYSSTASNYYCCSSTGGNYDKYVLQLNSSKLHDLKGGTSACPSGTPYIYPGTTLPLACTTGGPSCPPNYTCRQSATGVGFICCTSSAITAHVQGVLKSFLFCNVVQL